MNSRHLNLILIAIVIGLLGSMGFLVSWVKDWRRPTNPSERTIEIDNTVTQIMVKKFNATNLLEALANRAIGWRAIESTNYLLYILNLRNIGCPEQTIRDIIIADVAKLYRERRAEIETEAPPLEYWRTLADDEVYGTDPATKAQLDALETEKRRLVHDLLNADYDAEVAKFYPEDPNPRDRLYRFLPVEKRGEVMALLDHYEDLESQIHQGSGGLLLAEDEERLRQLEREKQEELAAILNPEELASYELHLSPLANALRYELHGFEPGPEEFQEIYRLRKTYDQVLDNAFDPAEKPLPSQRELALESAETALNAELRKVLGDERFKEYNRAQDPDWRVLSKLSERLNLPNNLPTQIYNMKLDAERQKQRLEINPRLTPEQRQQAMQAIARETQQALAKQMGQEAYEQYRQAAGGWIDDLSYSLRDLEVLLPDSGSTP